MMAMYLLEARIQIPINRRQLIMVSWPGSSVVVVSPFQQVRERYKIDSTSSPGGVTSAFSTIGPVICTSCQPGNQHLRSPEAETPVVRVAAKRGAPATGGPLAPLQS